MRIFLYELITGGGLLGDFATPPISLLAEGRAMIEALAADFALVAGVEVCTLRDARLPIYFVPGISVHDVRTRSEEADAFQELSSTADWTLLIAPESDGLLEQRARAVLAGGGRLLGPSPDIIALCADKQSTAEHLAAADVQVPFGVRIAAGEELPQDFPYPAVVKPIDGCGSQEIYRVESFARRPPPARYPRRLEEEFLAQSSPARYPCSVAVLAGPQATVALPAASQHLSHDGRYHYQGGTLGLPDPIALEAETLALAAVKTIPDALGWFGVDMVLGFTPGHGGVIEINPRLTTSYVGLRRAVDVNLAGLMLDIARGKHAEPPWLARQVSFLPDGRLRIC